MIRFLLIGFLSISLSFNLSSSYASSEFELDGSSLCGRLKRISHDVVAGEGFALSGEPVYIGIELADEDNAPKWVKYRNDTSRMCSTGDGILVRYARLSQPAQRPIYDERVKKETGYTPEEYADFMNTLYELKMYEPGKVKALESVAAGCAGFEVRTGFVNNEYAYYDVVYASKKPVTGKFPFRQTSASISVKEYFEAYDAILASIGVTDKGGPTCENRGIFRGPKTFITGGFTGLSGIVQGSTAEFHKSKELIAVAALPVMLNILRKLLKPDEIYIQGESVPNNLAHLLPQKGGQYDVPCLMKRDALARCYTSAAMPKPIETTRYRFMGEGDAPFFPFHVVGLSALENSHRWAEGKQVIFEVPAVYNNHRITGISFIDTVGLVTRNHSQLAHVSVNGKAVGSYYYDYVSPQRLIHVALPEGCDVARIVFDLPKTISPAELGLSSDKRKLGISFKHALIQTSRWSFHLGRDESFPYSFAGFSVPEYPFRWTDGNHATIRMPINHGHHHVKSVSFLNTSWMFAHMHEQNVYVSVNGKYINSYVYNSQTSQHTIDVPLPDDREDADISFYIPTAVAPVNLGINSDKRLLGVQFGAVELSCTKKTYNLEQASEFPFSLTGFSQPDGTRRWTEKNQAIIEVPLSDNPGNRPTMISFLDTKAYVSTKYPHQLLNLKLNGVAVGQFSYSVENNKRTLSVPIAANMTSPLKIEFELLNPISPQALGFGDDARKLGVELNKVRFTYAH